MERGTRLKLNIPETISASDDPVVIAVDSTGIKVTNRGEWVREKWKIHRGWIKVHLAMDVDVKTKEIAAIEVTDERVSDGSKFNFLVNQADGAYDRREIFDYLQEKGIQPVIKIRSNANTKARGSPGRARAVRELNDLGYQSWKKKYNYGWRWAAEPVFQQ